jgi:ferrous iron transport protein B
MRILLMGNPNVGKSTLFSRLTGVNVIISNYPGTTVEVKRGMMKYGEGLVEVIDVPGVYHLSPSSKADEVATTIFQEGDIIIDVVDSTNLERNLYLTLHLLQKNIPTILALNFWSETKHKGIEIDISALEEQLSLPVVPITALTGEGINHLVERIPLTATHSIHHDNDDEIWTSIGHIIKKAQTLHRKKHSFLEYLEDLSIKPLTGLPIALAILMLIFTMIRFLGEGLIAIFCDPLFAMLTPCLMFLSRLLGEGIIHDVLIGTLVDGAISYEQSLGLLTTGIYVPFAMVLPYVFSFYTILSLVEDSGYLPRLSTLIDTFMHKVGMHGSAVVPMLLGLGCNVPGILATRILETKKQRFIAATLMSISLPCASQTAMIMSLLGPYGAHGIGILFGTLFIVWFTLGFILNKSIKGSIPETFAEIPPYRMPYLPGVIKKVWMRLRNFFRAIPYLIIGILAVNILYATEALAFVTEAVAPFVENVLGLPKEAIFSLVMGMLRKDIAVGMLLPLGLSMKQLLIACVMLTMYFPCVGTFAVFLREFGWKKLMLATCIMMVTTLIVATTLAYLL